MGWLFNWRLWLVIFIGFYLYTNPGGAARTVHKAQGGLSKAGHSLSVFVNRL
jgi:hypothetical protein